MNVGWNGGRAGGQHRLAGARVAVAVGVDEVDAGEAVDLEVDEARARRCRGRCSRPARRRRRRRRRPRRRRARGARRPARPGRRASPADPQAAPPPWSPTRLRGRRARASSCARTPRSPRPTDPRRPPRARSAPRSRCRRPPAAGTPKPWIQICGARSCSWARSATRREYSRTNGSSGSSSAFQYGSVASVSRPGSAASRDQSLIPCGPSVWGSGQIVGLAPWAATCATKSPMKSTIESSRNASTSGVSSPGMSSPKRSRKSPRQTSQRQPQWLGSRPKCCGCVQCGSSQKMYSAPVSIAASIHSRTNSRTRGWFAQPAGTRRPVSSTWPISMLAGTKPLSASPPNMRHTPQGPICTTRPASCEAADDLVHRRAVVGQVVLGVGVQHAGEAALGERLHVGGDVAHDPVAEIRSTDAHPLIAPAVRMVIRCLRSRRNTTATGSV